MLKINRRGGGMGLASLIAMCHVIWFAGGERKELVALRMKSCPAAEILITFGLREIQHSLTADGLSIHFLPNLPSASPVAPKQCLAQKTSCTLTISFVKKKRFSNSLSFPNSIAPRISTIPLPNPPNTPPPLESKISNRK